MSMQKKTKIPATFVAQPKDKKLKWFLIDAEGKTLGRLASEVAQVLRGKHQVDFTPNVDTGDGVVVVNAEKIVVSGNKEAQKLYRHYSGYMSGLKEIPYRTMMERHPERIIERAVKGMMPKTRLGKAQYKRLRVVAGTEHGLNAQQPVAVNV